MDSLQFSGAFMALEISFSRHRQEHHDQAFAVWRDLQSNFSQSDIFKICDLQDELLKVQQRTLDISSSYYTALKTLWEEIETFCVTNLVIFLALSLLYLLLNLIVSKIMY